MNRSSNPPFRSFLIIIGPGLLVAATGVGAGDRRRAGAHGGRRGRRVLPPGEDVRRRGDVRGPGRGGARRGPLRDRGGDDGHGRVRGRRASDEQLRADRR